MSDDCRAAAAQYRKDFGWDCGANDREVWLCLGYDMASITVYRSVEGHNIDGPVIGYAGRPNRLTFLTRATTPLPASLPGWLHYAGPRVLIDLPPSQQPAGPAVWTAKPTPSSARLPDRDAVVARLQEISQQE
jgi:hypothetical protein